MNELVFPKSNSQLSLKGNQQPISWKRNLSILAVLVVACWNLESVMGASPWQRVTNPAPAKPAPVNRPPVAAKPKQKKDKVEIKIPSPKKITLETSDNVNLKCTYFDAPIDPEAEAGSGKTVMPFILIHDWEGDRTDLLPFAAFLQRMGTAVIVPDLRGHGDSVTVTGVTKPIDYDRFRKAELASVVKDIEACKKYLVERNNEGELNIDLLNIVAVGESSVLALNWAIRDWSWPQVGSIKQGQDVKSITLISPRRKLESLSLNNDLKNPLFSGRNGNNLPTLIVWGSNDDTATKDGNSIYEYMERGRPDLTKIEDPGERLKQTTLFKGEIPNTSLTGTELIRNNRVAVLWQYIAKFVDSQVGAKKDDYRWQSRERN